MDNMRSSYIENNYGNVFRSLVLAKEPRVIVELGVLDGYSLYHMAHALRFNHSRWSMLPGKLYAYDLWDDYQYKHGNFDDVQNMIKEKALNNYVELRKGNAYKVYKDFKDDCIDMLHVDISNHGDVLLSILDLWGSKLKYNGMILFEGGSLERDNIEWMKKYNYPSILNELSNNPVVYKNWDFQIFSDFPSVTLLWKK